MSLQAHRDVAQAWVFGEQLEAIGRYDANPQELGGLIQLARGIKAVEARDEEGGRSDEVIALC